MSKTTERTIKKKKKVYKFRGLNTNHNLLVIGAHFVLSEHLISVPIYPIAIFCSAKLMNKITK